MKSWCEPGNILRGLAPHANERANKILIKSTQNARRAQLLYARSRTAQTIRSSTWYILTAPFHQISTKTILFKRLLTGTSRAVCIYMYTSDVAKTLYGVIVNKVEKFETRLIYVYRRRCARTPSITATIQSRLSYI